MEQGLEELLGWKGLVVALWLLAFFAGERLLPAAVPPAALQEAGPTWRRVARNLLLWAINVGLSPLLVLPLTLWASSQALDWRPVWWGGWAGLLADLLLLDFLIYWWHRANHVVPLLWRFHAVHHRDRFLDSTSALRFHFGEVLLSALARALVIILIGFPFTSVLVFEALLLMAAIFHHANLRLPAGLEAALSRIIITPSIHWVHHHAVRRDTDSNYGTLLSIWDPIFGSRSPARRTPAMPIGIEGLAQDVPLTGLLAQPFGGQAGLSDDRRADRD